MRRSSRWWSLLTAVAFATGCNLIEDTTQSTGAIEGRGGTYEFAADAPWRMEPTPGTCPSAPGTTCMTYGPIPIQLAILDGNLENLAVTRSLLGNPTHPALVGAPEQISYRRLVKVKAITVTDVQTGIAQLVEIGGLHEVERVEDHWRVQTALPYAEKPAPLRTVCRAWRGNDCSGWGDVQNTSEWHATLMYTPPAVTAGATRRLKIEMQVSQVDVTGQIPTLPDATLTQHVAVKYGDAPLPRFGDGWAYGDLHYHSQGTDNEGESGHSYRGVVNALAAIGLDFTFATDHASASEQIARIEVPWGTAFMEDLLRDTDELRFAYGLDWLHGPSGANEDVIGVRRLASAGSTKLRVPQLFLGGEVDAIPETASGSTTFLYGNGQVFDIARACGMPYAATLLYDGCGTAGVNALIQNSGDGRLLIKDLQGKAEPSYFARQHFLHLPFDKSNPKSFIPSWTSRYGGATRRLRDFLRNDYDLAHKGVMFLAHPVAARGTEATYGRMAGPDLVPYSPVQIDDAFASPHVLGLQLWNEDARLSSAGTATGTPGIQGVVSPWSHDFYTTWDGLAAEPSLYSSLHHGAALWDRMLRRGIDETELRRLPWVASGQPRRVLMAGGSDAHGDLNYRREGYLVEEISGYTDTALGKPRNLVFAGAPQGAPLVPGVESAPFTQSQIVAGLQSGQFSITDGPAVRIAWDVNRNGDIDAGDVPMGAQVDYTGSPPPLVVQWISTPEFGPVQRIDLYVGVRNEENLTSMTYAPKQHGVRNSSDPASATASSPVYIDPRTNRRFQRGPDGYWVPLDTSLSLAVGTLSGKQTVVIDPAHFPAGVASDATRTLDRSRRADRMYVRAFAATSANSDPYCVPNRGECISRFAFTNPVWARNLAPSPSGTLVGHGGNCLTVQNATTTNGSRMVMWQCNGGTNQQLTWNPLTSKIVAYDDKRVDLLGFNNVDGAPLGIWDPYDGLAQIWRMTSPHLVMGSRTLAAFSYANGGAVGLWSAPGWTPQTWELTASGELRTNGKCLDVYASGTWSGTPAVLYDCYGTPNQKWTVEHGGRIRGYGGQCLTATANTNGATMVMTPCTDTPLQQWQLRGEIRSGYNNKCMDVYGAYTWNGTAVNSYTCHGGPNQQWTYTP